TGKGGSFTPPWDTTSRRSTPSGLSPRINAERNGPLRARSRRRCQPTSRVQTRPARVRSTTRLPAGAHRVGLRISKAPLIPEPTIEPNPLRPGPENRALRAQVPALLPKLLPRADKAEIRRR